MEKSADAAASNLRSIFSQGVNKSLKLITAKSLTKGAPSFDAAAVAAVTPGTISTGTSVFSIGSNFKNYASHAVDARVTAAYHDDAVVFYGF